MQDALFRAGLKRQYHAGLAMVRQGIERCPDEAWDSLDRGNAFWRIVYHVLFYTNVYLQRTEAEFRPCELHQTGLQDLDDVPTPPEIQQYLELPHRPPRSGTPYTKEQLLAYWNRCDDLVDGAVEALDLDAPHSGFSWYAMPKIEHQLVAIRHLQHHVAQLGDRIRAATGTAIEWVR